MGLPSMAKSRRKKNLAKRRNKRLKKKLRGRGAMAAHPPVERKVAGSNPVVPANYNENG